MDVEAVANFQTRFVRGGLLSFVRDFGLSICVNAGLSSRPISSLSSFLLSYPCPLAFTFSSSCSSSSSLLLFWSVLLFPHSAIFSLLVNYTIDRYVCQRRF
jgi:hypothetical protein